MKRKNDQMINIHLVDDRSKLPPCTDNDVVLLVVKDPIIGIGNKTGKKYHLGLDGSVSVVCGRRTGLAGRIRAEIRILGKNSFSPAEIARALGIHPAIRVREALRPFFKRGEIERISPGRYIYKGNHMLGVRPARVKPRIYRAMHATQTFTSRDIACLSDAKIKLVKKTIWQLRRIGSITLVGTKGARHGGREYIYRVRDRDEFFLRYIRPLTADGRRPTETKNEEKS